MPSTAMALPLTGSACACSRRRPIARRRAWPGTLRPGDGEYLDVLEAERSDYLSRRALSIAATEQRLAVVGIYKALGVAGRGLRGGAALWRGYRRYLSRRGTAARQSLLISRRPSRSTAWVEGRAARPPVIWRTPGVRIAWRGSLVPVRFIDKSVPELFSVVHSDG